MTKRAWIGATTLAALLAAGTTDAIAAKAGGTTACPILPTTDFAVYGQTFKGGVGTSSRSWMAHFFDWWKAQDSSVDYQFLTAAQAQACTSLKTSYPNLKMWVQPGGNAYDQQSALGATGKANINAFIVDQGAYLGVCAGAYFAAPNYWWEGKYYAHPNLLGAYPVTMEGAISSIAPWPGYAMTVLSNGRNAIYYGGPTVGLQRTNAGDPARRKGGELRQHRRRAPGGHRLQQAAADERAPRGFRERRHQRPGHGDRTENYKYLANLINSVTAGGLPRPALCRRPARMQRQADNDGDGKIDLLDPGCSSALDTDETDAPAGQVIADGFENGLGAGR